MVSMIDLEKFWVVLNNTALRRMGEQMWISSLS